MDAITARPSRIQRFRHELQRRSLEVLDVLPLGASFVRLRFGGPELADFVSMGFDDHVKLILDPEPAQAPVMRDFTPRRFDPQACTLDIEFALHAHGVASTWARQARPGQRATVGGPRGSMVVPMDHDWHLLVGDAAAVPAIGRRLDELPAAARVIVVAQLPEAADQAVLRQSVRPGAAVELRFAADTESLLAQVTGLRLPAGEGFAWGAGEAGAMARLRELLRAHHAHPREAMRVSAYWRTGSQGFHEDL